MQDMYLEEIMDHYKHPRNSGKIENPDISFNDTNPLCGDEIKLTIKLNKDKVEDLKFISKGCAISVASTSMLSEKLKGKSLEEIRNMKNEEVFDLLGIEISPMRIKCALLSLKAIQKAIITHMAGEKK